MASGETKESLATRPVVPPRIADTATECASSGTQSERGKLARMLHDDIAQVLSAAGMQLNILRMDFAEALPGIASRTAEIQKLIDHAIKHVRDLSHELNPPVVESAGLQSSAEWLRRALDATNSSDFGHAMCYVEAGLRIEPDNAELAQLREQLTLTLSEGERRRKETRYGQLVNHKYEMGLTQDEEQELQSLYDELAALDEPFYRPLIQNLEARIKR